MIQWLKNLLTAPKKSAKIVKRWVIRPNTDQTVDELYDYITQKEQKTEKTTINRRIPENQNTSTEGRPCKGK